METRIFKQALFTAVAVMALSTGALAQRAKAKAPAKPKPPVAAESPEFDSDTFDLQMDKLNVQMNNLATNINVNLGDLGAQLKDSFKDFGKNISASIVPNVSVNLDGLNTLNNISVNTNDEDYQEKVASGQMNEKIKNYTKTYSVGSNDLIQINNSFGKVIVNTWDRKEVKVDIKMILGAEDEDDVNDLVRNITISDSKVGSTVSFKTNINNNNSHSGRGNHMEINYTVYLPAGNPLDIKNSFGNVVVPDMTGKTTLRVSYGALTAQQLLSTDNDVKVSFGDATIANFNGGRLAVSYGKLKAGTVSNVDLDVDFAGFSADKLKNSVKADIKYGDGFNIGSIDKSVRSLLIKASFTKIRLDFNDAESFNFDIICKMGGFNYNDDNVKVTSKSPTDDDRGWSSTKTYRGYIGKNNSDGKISINANFTDVRFN